MTEARKKRPRLNKTEESIFTLLSLFILTVQAFEALTEDENILSAEDNYSTGTFKEISNDTIREALIYQMLLKTCSFMDEWNKVFGVSTLKKDALKIREVKRVVKPATQNITSWKGLRDFRNHFIAHNLRNQKGQNVFLHQSRYHCPQTPGEIYLLAVSLKKIMTFIDFAFPSAVGKCMAVLRNGSLRKGKGMSKREIMKKIKNTEVIDNTIADALMRAQIVEATVRASQKASAAEKLSGLI